MKASPFLRRMRLDGFESASVPFAEEHVQAWRRGPTSDMDACSLLNALKVCLSQKAQIACAPDVIHLLRWVLNGRGAATEARLWKVYLKSYVSA